MRERGSVAIVAVTGTLVLCLMSLGAADVGSMLHARAKAQAAADAAALAAAVRLAPALGQQGDPHTAAREQAEANGAQLVRCDCVGTGAEVEVSIESRVSLVTPWRGRSIRARARAEVDPDVMSYRDSG